MHTRHSVSNWFFEVVEQSKSRHRLDENRCMADWISGLSGNLRGSDETSTTFRHPPTNNEPMHPHSCTLDPNGTTVLIWLKPQSLIKRIIFMHGSGAGLIQSDL